MSEVEHVLMRLFESVTLLMAGGSIGVLIVVIRWHKKKFKYTRMPTTIVTWWLGAYLAFLVVGTAQTYATMEGLHHWDPALAVMRFLALCVSFVSLGWGLYTIRKYDSTQKDKDEEGEGK